MLRKHLGIRFFLFILTGAGAVLCPVWGGADGLGTEPFLPVCLPQVNYNISQDYQEVIFKKHVNIIEGSRVAENYPDNHLF